MTLEREYDPTVQDASKVNTLPVIKEPEVKKKMPIDYANFTIAADPAKEISLLPSGNIMTDIQYNKRRGYFNFGGGTYLNLNGDLGISYPQHRQGSIEYLVLAPFNEWKSKNTCKWMKRLRRS